MKLAAVIALLLLLVLAAVVVAGYTLPATREGAAARTFTAPPELVRGTILDIDSQPAWRARVVAIERVSDDDWTEITADGERIAFRLRDNTDARIALEFSSSRGYTGRWDAETASSPSGGTTLSVREQATTPSPMGRILSRLFFDPQAFAATYLDELSAEVERRSNGME